MPLTTKRFKFLTNETNLSVSNLNKATNEGTLNIPASVKDSLYDSSFLKNDKSSFLDSINGSSDLVNEFDKFINEDIVKKPDDIIKFVTDGKKSLDRRTRDISANFKSVTDAKSFKEVAKGVKGLSNGIPDAFQSLSKLSDKSQSLLTSKTNIGKSINKTGINNTSNTSGCVSSLLGQYYLEALAALGGLAAYIDYDKLLSQILGLVSFGYSLDLCNVFSSVSKHVLDTTDEPNKSKAKLLLNRASASLTKELNDKGNINGILDLASSSAALNPKTEYPGIVEGVTENFNTGRFKDNEIISLRQRLDASLELFDDEWDTNGSVNIAPSGSPTVFNFSTNGVKNKSLSDLYRSSSISSPNLENITGGVTLRSSLSNTELTSSLGTGIKSALNTPPSNDHIFKAAAFL